MKIFGYQHGQSVFYDVRILACCNVPFRGPHLVSICQNTPFWVQSLTAFKKNFFVFEDHLSFERSFFILFSHQDEQQLVRLQSIRFVATVPKQVLPFRSNIHVSPSKIKPAKRVYYPKLIKKPDVVRKAFLHKTVQKLLAMYIKLYPQVHGDANLFRAQCIHMLCQDFQDACDHIMDNLVPLDIEDLVEAICEEIDPEEGEN
jgi:hypothetical protein